MYNEKIEFEINLKYRSFLGRVYLHAMYARHIKLLNLYKDLIENTDYKDINECSRKVSVLLDHGLRNLNYIPCEKASQETFEEIKLETRRVLFEENTWDNVEKIWKIPPEIRDSVLISAIMKHCLSKMKIKLDDNVIDQYNNAWSNFRDNFGMYILSA